MARQPRNSSQPNGNGKLYRPEEAASYLGLTPATLKRLRLTGQISYLRSAPRCIRFTQEHLDGYLRKIEAHATR